jgi:predicted Zn-dependent protease
MTEIIACPNCQRRLHLPEGVDGPVQCPSCQAQFPAAQGRVQPAPKFIPTLEHYVAREDADYRGRDDGGLRRPRQPPPAATRPSRLPWFLGGVALCVVAVVVGLGAYGLARMRAAGPFARPLHLRRAQAQAHRNEGDDLLDAGRLAEAAAAYRNALDLDPQDSEAFLGLIRAVPWNDDLSDVPRRFAKLRDPDENFELCFELCAVACEERRFPRLLEKLVEAMRRVDPDYLRLDYYLALCKARSDETQQAVALFRSALNKQPDAEKREEYVRGFLSAMAEAGKFEEAYGAAPDARTAFRLLAANSVGTYRTDGLKRLVILHGKKHAADPLLPWYQAEVYAREGRYARADKAFTDALAHPPDDATMPIFRANRVLARYHTGHALDAYRDIGPPQETFLQLASLAFQDEKNDVLQALLDAHAKNEPDSVDVLTYRARLKIRQDKVDDGIALFRAALTKMQEEKHEGIVYRFLADLVSAGKAVEGYQAAPDAKKAFQFAAEELLEQERAEELPRLIAAHRQREPADPWLDYYQAEVFFEEKAWDKAAAALAEGLKKAAPDEQQGFRRQYVYAMYKASRGMQAYQESPERDRTFVQLADLLAGDKKGGELENLIAAHRRLAAPTDPEPIFYNSLAKVLLKQPDEAVHSFNRACQLQTNEYLRAQYVSRFVLAMTEAGYLAQAYQAAPDKSAAFRTLAAELQVRKKDKDLAALLDLHRDGHDKEPWYQFYAGQVELLRGQPKRAEEHFAAGLAAVPRVERWSLRTGLFQARVKAGKAVAAYQEYEPGASTFADLARICAQEKDARQLQALIDAHRKADPDDDSLPAWEVEVKYLNEDYEGALKLLAENREEAFSQPVWPWKADDYRVRCLVKLKRTDDALREAEALAKKRTGSRLFLVLAQASTGDVKQTIAALGKSPQPYFLSDCYKDPDLGPILRSEAFKELQEKFPEPTDEELLAARLRDD